MKPQKYLAAALCILFVIIPLFPVGASAGPTLTTTLTDRAVQRGSKKTFDVRARNAAGEKIRATVRLNGQRVDPTWDDSDKTGYTLVFTKEGENTVTVSASSDGGKKKELTYHITYQKAAPGEEIGAAVWSVELFTVGCGYLIFPEKTPIYEGETAAEQLLRLLCSNGFVGYYGGTPQFSFYLGYIADGTASGEKYNQYSKSETPQKPKKLNLSPAIPAVLTPFLKNTMTFFDPEDYRENWTGYIGEFVFTNGSGWMYSVNHNFPNVGFSDTFLSDGDVVRVQFTLAYGADIGGLGSVGNGGLPGADGRPTVGCYTVADKDELSKAICRALSSERMSEESVKTAYERALSVMETLDASQSSVNSAVDALNSALTDPVKEPAALPTETASASGGASGTDGQTDRSDAASVSSDSPADTPDSSDETALSGVLSSGGDTDGYGGRNTTPPVRLLVITGAAIFLAAAVAAAAVCIRKRNPRNAEETQ